MKTVLDLFSGVGGFSLGLERAGGYRTVAFCEINDYCRRVLARHWPEVPIHDDVRSLTAADVQCRVDVICGGFPCQDISFAGAGAGLDGERSGLWFEYARLVGEFRPDYVVVENVAALLDRGMGDVLGSLASFGYDAEWSVVSSCALGATHMRRRVFVVAYPNGKHGRQGIWHPDARQGGALQTLDGFESARTRARTRMANPSALYGGADGLANGLERNHALGNSVDPAIVEMIGRVIMAARQ